MASAQPTSASTVPESSAPRLPVERPPAGARNGQIVEVLLRMATDLKINGLVVSGDGLEVTGEERLTARAVRATMVEWGLKPWQESQLALDELSARDALYRVKWLDSSIGENRIRALLVSIRESTKRVSAELAVRRALRDSKLYGGPATIQNASVRADGDGLMWGEVCPDKDCTRYKAMYFVAAKPQVKPMSFDTLNRLHGASKNRLEDLTSKADQVIRLRREAQALYDTAEARLEQARVAQAQREPGWQDRVSRAVALAQSASNQAATKAAAANNLKPPSQTLRNQIKDVDDQVGSREAAALPYLNWIARNVGDSQVPTSSLRTRAWAKNEQDREVRLADRRGMRLRPAPIFTSRKPAGAAAFSADPGQDALDDLQNIVGVGTIQVTPNPPRIRPTNPLMTLIEALCHCVKPYFDAPAVADAANDLLEQEGHSPLPVDRRYAENMGLGRYLEMNMDVQQWLRDHPNANPKDAAQAIANIRRRFEGKRDLPSGVSESALTAIEEFADIEADVEAAIQAADKARKAAKEAEDMERSGSGSSDDTGGDSSPASTTGPACGPHCGDSDDTGGDSSPASTTGPACGHHCSTSSSSSSSSTSGSDTGGSSSNDGSDYSDAG